MAIRIFVDAGHNPEPPNTGAEGFGRREQDITYAVAKELEQLLSGDPDFEVRLSRPTPETQLGDSNTGSLRARTDAANRWGADWFTSLHTNAANSPDAGGTEGYAYSKNSRGYRLGKSIVDSISEASGFRNRGMKVNPTLYVLRRTAMPAVLIEMGFITNPYEGRVMEEDPGLFAGAVFRGIRSFFGLS